MKEKMKKSAKASGRRKGAKAMQLHCECGGTLKPVTIPYFDFTPWSGISSRLTDVPGYRCSNCGGETLPGVVINTSLRALAMSIVKLPHRLSADLAKYLRRTLEITQQELADRMGIVRETVAQWECGEREISPQQDMILRTIVINRYLGQDGVLPHEFKKIEIEALDALSSVRSEPPKKKLTALVVPKANYADAYAS